MIASRRSLLASLASMAAMGWVCAQGKVARIAYLNSGREATQAAYVGALREGLRDQGLIVSVGNLDGHTTWGIK